MSEVVIHTDGACLGNPGPGGWAALLVAGKREREISGAERDTTNNRMEMMAAIAALEALRKPCTVNLYTDSQYVRQGMTEWLKGWRARGWKTSGGDPVKNKDLWERLVAAAAVHTVHWHWVKGHAGDPANERVDQLARSAAERIRNEAA